MSKESLKFLQNKQKAYLKEHKVYATDDTLISEWIDEYHENCVMSDAINDKVLGNANEDIMLRKLWMSIVKTRLASTGNNKHPYSSYEVGGFANDIITNYRDIFINYIEPQPYEPQPVHGVVPNMLVDTSNDVSGDITLDTSSYTSIAVVDNSDEW